MPKKIDEARVFEVVLQLWIEHGYAGTTTRDVADLAGVNEATLYRRYGNKLELVVTALRAQLRQVELRQIEATDDVERDLARIVEAYLATVRRIGSVFPLLLVEAAREPELRGALDIALENVRFLLDVIEHHQSRGVLRVEDPLAGLTGLLGPLFVIGMFRRALPDGPTVEIDVDAHVRAFLHGRAVHPTGSTSEDSSRRD